MVRGFQPDPVREYAAAIELAAGLARWRQAEADTRRIARQAIHDGVRSSTVAEALEMSRSTLYRWINSDSVTSEPSP